MPNTTHQDKLTEILSYPRLRRACAVELCDAWRTAQWDVIRAYADWCAAPPATRQDAYVAYRAAADREGAAAGVWQASVGLTAWLEKRASSGRTRPQLGRGELPHGRRRGWLLTGAGPLDAATTSSASSAAIDAG
ncbi:MAG: hypothetical protein M3R46_15995 [Actinomycetota bacterium]|nr:hypothetical protein [Actinomycetota bacterium]